MSIFNKMEELLAKGCSFASAVIVSRSGSAPRAAGARMVVCPDGSIIGTIGGGLVEAQTRDLAMDVFRTAAPVLRKFSFSAEEADGAGMICGGEVDVLVHFVDASSPSNLEICRQAAAALRSRERALLITEVPAQGPGALALVKADGSCLGRIEPGAARALAARPAANSAGLASCLERLFFVEPLRREESVFIFGAGHISQKLALLTRLTGFTTIVLDDRSEFANRDRFKTADQIIVADSFERAIEKLEIDEESLVVLVTRGHAHDKTLLRQALGTRAGYIGMIGSKRKRDALYCALEKEGFTKSDFDRMRSPIGLDIGAETPEEIAVSIAAELIQVRAAARGGGAFRRGPR